VAHDVGSDFKSQYHQKKKNTTGASRGGEGSGIRVAMAPLESCLCGSRGMGRLPRLWCHVCVPRERPVD
jgi:hypothetical protein